MTENEFFLRVAENWNSFYVTTILVLLAYYMIFRRFVLSVFDPMALALLFSAFGSVVTIFLYSTGDIESHHLVIYLLTQIAFLTGLLLYGRDYRATLEEHRIVVGTVKVDRKVEPLIFGLVILTVLVCEVITVYTRGIPLLMESRLETFQGGSGFGVIARIKGAAFLIAIFLLVRRLVLYERNSSYRKIQSALAWLAIFVVLLMSGSKGAFLSILFTIFLYSYFLNFKKVEITVKQKKKIRKVARYLLVLAVLAAFAVVGMQLERANSSAEVVLIINKLINRIIKAGDVFYMAYPGGAIDMLQPGYGLAALFSDPLGMSRLIDRRDLPTSLGLQLYQYHYNSDQTFGPNSRHNVFGYFYFGVLGGIIFSFLSGVAISFTRYRVLRLLPMTTIGALTYVSLMIIVVGINVDPTLWVGRMTNFLMFCVPVIILYHFLLKKVYKNGYTRVI